MATKKRSGGRKYGKAAGKSVKSAMHRYKKGSLKAGKGRHPKAKSREQAIAIGLSEAREKGAKVPRKRTSKKSATKKRGAKKSGGRKSTAKKGSTRKRSSSKKSSSRKRSTSKKSSSRKRSTAKKR